MVPPAVAMHREGAAQLQQCAAGPRAGPVPPLRRGRSVPGRPPGLWWHLGISQGGAVPSESVAAFAPHTEHQGHVLSCLRRADRSRLLPLPTL